MNGKMFGVTQGETMQTLTTKDATYNTILLKNPDGNTKNIIISDITFSTTTNSRILYRIYFNPIVTDNGTSLTPYCTRLGSNINSLCKVYSIPTISPDENGIMLRSYSLYASTERLELDGKLILKPGTSLLITARPSANTVSSTVDMTWAEV